MYGKNSQVGFSAGIVGEEKEYYSRLLSQSQKTSHQETK